MVDGAAKLASKVDRAKYKYTGIDVGNGSVTVTVTNKSRATVRTLLRALPIFPRGPTPKGPRM